MNRTAFILLAVVTGFSLRASAQTAAELKIKERSTFKGAPTMRDPFWPIGWQKRAPEGSSILAPKTGSALVASPEMFLKPELFIVSSISTGAVPIAIINGKMYGEGELIPFNAGGPKPVSAQVYKISDGTVTLRYQAKTVVIFQRGLQR